MSYSPKISVIVPVYNAEHTIIETLDSIRNQTFTDFEVIIINDGSTDNSLTLLKDYISSDQRFQLIIQNNAGVSVARNTGLDNVKGEWVCFIDSDDLISANYLASLANKISSDIEQIQISEINIWGCEDKTIYVERFVENEVLKYVLKHPYMVYVWGKLYRTKILKEWGIEFNHELVIGEDFLFNIQYSKFVNKLSFTDSGAYFYRAQQSSLSRKFNSHLLKARNDTGIAIYSCLSNYLQVDELKGIYTEFSLLGSLRYILKNREYLKLFELKNFIDKDKLSIEVIFHSKSNMFLRIIALLFYFFI